MYLPHNIEYYPRQQQTEEAELKETNFLIRKNLISKIAEQKVEEGNTACLKLISWIIN